MWIQSMCRELRIITHGYGTTPGTNTVNFMDHSMIATISKDQGITYARIVVDNQPYKE